jgi:NOL1/NOP2/fmu family ribosome biogenesis protein
LYSTCTFSPDEDEQMMAWFLKKYPDMELMDLPPYEGFSGGRPEWADGREDLRKCVRIWPHVMDGEGHFLALLRKRGGKSEEDRADGRETVSAADSRRCCADYALAEQDPESEGGRKKIKKKDRKKNGKMPRGLGGGRSGQETGGARSGSGMTADQAEWMHAFLAGSRIPDTSVVKFGDKGYLKQELPNGAQHLNFLRNGILIGEWKKNRFEPSQQLAMALRPEEYGKTFSMKPDDVRIGQYLRGESFYLEEGERAEDGWNLVCVDDFPLGWAKISRGQVKNKYANSWRRS